MNSANHQLYAIMADEITSRITMVLPTIHGDMGGHDEYENEKNKIRIDFSGAEESIRGIMDSFPSGGKKYAMVSIVYFAAAFDGRMLETKTK